MYCTPQPAAPAAARAAIPGRLGASPMATLTGICGRRELAHAADDVREVGAQRAFARVLDVHDVRVPGHGGADLVLADHADEKLHARQRTRARERGTSGELSVSAADRSRG